MGRVTSRSTRRYAERCARGDERSATRAAVAWARPEPPSGHPRAGTPEVVISSAEHPARPTSALVWARAGVLGAVVLLSGAVSHVVADGLLPHPVVLGAVLAACVVLAAAFLRTRASTGRLVALVVGGQTLTHLLLSATAGHHGSAAPAGAPSGGAGPALQAAADDGGRRVGSLADHFDAAATVGGRGADTAAAGPWGGLGGALGHLVEHTVAQGPLMLLAHTAGAVVLGLWLAVGERALWGLLVLTAVQVRMALVVARCARPLRAALLGALATARRLAVPVPLHLPLPDSLPHRLVTRRGPPALLTG